MKAEIYDSLDLWKQVESVLTLIQDADAALTSEVGESLDRVRFLGRLLLEYRTTDPALFTPEMVQQVNYSNVYSYLNSGISNVGNATPYVNSALAEAEAQYRVTVTHWPSLTSSQSDSAAMRSSEDAREAMLQVRRLSDEYRAVAEANQTASREELAGLVTRIAELAARISVDEGRLDTALTATNTTFTDAQTARENAFQTWLKSQEEANDATMTQVFSDSNSIVSQMRLLQSETEDLGTKVTQGFLAKDYGHYANREYWMGVLANVLGFATLIVAAVVLYRIINDAAVSGSVSWPFTALRLGFTLTVGAASAVLLRFGGQSLRRAEKSKRSELGLRALTPLLASMEPDTAQEVRKAFIERSFGQASELEQPTGSPALQPLDLVKLIELVLARR